MDKEPKLTVGKADRTVVGVLARNIWGERPSPDGERGSASL